MLRNSNLYFHVVAVQECCIPEVNSYAGVVQYLHLWDEESKYILSSLVDFIELRGHNDMQVNVASIQTLLRT